MTRKFIKSLKSLTTKTCITSVVISALSLTGCQTLFPQKTVVSTSDLDSSSSLTPKRLDSFSITGKIGVVNKNAGQSGSAFYGWSQEQERFTIELQGALGIGYTLISYDGVKATLTNSNVGLLESETPEELLLKATGWQAPISQLPYWISGSPAPSDDSQTLDSQSRLIMATNKNWTAYFTYSNNNKLPKKIISRYKNIKKDSLNQETNIDQNSVNDNKVVLTILHNK